MDLERFMKRYQNDNAMKNFFRDRAKFEDSKELQEIEFEEKFKPITTKLDEAQKQAQKHQEKLAEILENQSQLLPIAQQPFQPIDNDDSFDKKQQIMPPDLPIYNLNKDIDLKVIKKCDFDPPAELIKSRELIPDTLSDLKPKLNELSNKKSNVEKKETRKKHNYELTDQDKEQIANYEYELAQLREYRGRLKLMSEAEHQALILRIYSRTVKLLLPKVVGGLPPMVAALASRLPPMAAA